MNHYDEENTLLNASMRIILQPLVEEIDAVIEASTDADQELPDELKKRISKVLFGHKLKSFRKYALVIGKRAAVFLMILMTLLTVACASIKPLRENIFNAIITWYDEYFTFAFNNEEGPENTAEITDEKFSYLPEGYTITSDMSAGKYREVLIENGETLISYWRKPHTEKSHMIDSDFIVVGEIEIQGHTVIYLNNPETNANILTWVENGYEFMISAVIDKSELIKILEGIEYTETIE